MMDYLGPCAEEYAGEAVTLIFYPGEQMPKDTEVLAALPDGLAADASVTFERRSVSRDWVDGRKEHFRPVTIGRVRVRPPWEPRADLGDASVDVEINPGLGFGTGLHPTTRGTLTLLQEGAEACGVSAGRGALVDAGTGSGILCIAAAKLGWRPVTAFDNDALALLSTRENVRQNGVEEMVEVHECDVLEAPPIWFEGATVLANMTLGPVLLLIDKLRGSRLSRVVVSGILAGSQEAQCASEAARCGFTVGRKLYEAEWVSMVLSRPADGEA